LIHDQMLSLARRSEDAKFEGKMSPERNG